MAGASERRAGDAAAGDGGGNGAGEAGRGGDAE